MTSFINFFSRVSKYIRKNFELLSWVTALTALFFLPETKSDTSLCVFSVLGFGPCPGCGIGHAIHYALWLDPVASFGYHPLGIIAVIVIFIRIKQLLYQTNNPYET